MRGESRSVVVGCVFGGVRKTDLVERRSATNVVAGVVGPSWFTGVNGADAGGEGGNGKGKKGKKGRKRKKEREGKKKKDAPSYTGLICR